MTRNIFGKRIVGAVDGFSGICAALGSVAVIGIMLATVSDVVGRVLFRSSVAGAVEVAELLLVAAAFLGLGLAQKKRAHVSIALLKSQISRRAARAVQIVAGLILLAYFAWAGTASIIAAWQAFVTGDYRFGLINIPTWPARTAIAAGFVAIFMQVLISLGEPESSPDAAGALRHE
jgi:TRAP-type C4-dicarboxylate transport system permease small subunit